MYEQVNRQVSYEFYILSLHQGIDGLSIYELRQFEHL